MLSENRLSGLVFCPRISCCDNEDGACCKTKLPLGGTLCPLWAFASAELRFRLIGAHFILRKAHSKNYFQASL